MNSQIIQRETKLIGDELIEKFILGDKKVLKYINSFYSNENIKVQSENKSKSFSNEQREILSVSEINQTANDFLNEAFPPLWVAGEISNFREYGTSGHWYFSIKDPDFP